METTKPAPKSFWKPTIAYTLIDAINRIAAATGSPRYADLASHADYNGHFVRVYFNDYRQYWLAEYTWAGRNVLARGSLEQCLRAALAEYARGAKGCEVSCTVTTDEDAAIVEGAGLVPWSKEIEAAHYATWKDARFDKVTEAMSYEKHGLAPAVGFLANSRTAEEYEAKMEAFFAERKAARESLGPA